MTEQVMRHTKIIATIGPASRSPTIIEQMIDAGVDICRLNFSHGSHEAHGETFHRIRAAAAKAGKVIAILQDLSGPKIRTGRLKGGTPVAQSECPYPNYSSAWRATARNLNSHEMMITAIALRRYHRQHGRMPGELAALVPAYLKAVPRDIVDGQPLRYRLNADGSFTLYSIGEDATDDGGDKRPPVASSSGSLPGFSSGRDWVWPQLAAAVEPSKP